MNQSIAFFLLKSQKNLKDRSMLRSTQKLEMGTKVFNDNESVQSVRGAGKSTPQKVSMKGRSVYLQRGLCFQPLFVLYPDVTSARCALYSTPSEFFTHTLPSVSLLHMLPPSLFKNRDPGVQVKRLRCNSLQHMYVTELQLAEYCLYNQSR